MTTKRTWYKALGLDELPEGRVKSVTCGLATVCVTHFEGNYAALDNRCPHLGWPSRRGLDRERLSTMSVARLGFSSSRWQAARRLRRRRRDVSGRDSGRRRLRGFRGPDRIVPHGLGRHGGDDGGVGRRFRLRHGGPLEPGPRGSDSETGGSRKADLYRHPARGRRVLRRLRIWKADWPTRGLLFDRRSWRDEHAHRPVGRPRRPSTRPRPDRSGRYAGSGAWGVPRGRSPGGLRQSSAVEPNGATGKSACGARQPRPHERDSRTGRLTLGLSRRSPGSGRR